MKRTAAHYTGGAMRPYRVKFKDGTEVIDFGSSPQNVREFWAMYQHAMPSDFQVDDLHEIPDSEVPDDVPRPVDYDEPAPAGALKAQAMLSRRGVPLQPVPDTSGDTNQAELFNPYALGNDAQVSLI